MKLKELAKKFLWSNFLFRRVYYFLRNDRDKYIKKFKGVPGDRQKMLINLIKYGCAYDEYYYLGIYQNPNGAEGFITENNRYKYYDLLNKRDNRINFDDKARTYGIFGKYYKRELKKINSKEDLNAWVEKHDSFIVKPLNSSCGKGIKVIQSYNHGEDCELWNELSSMIPCIVEELISQSKTMASLHIASGNTVRITSILTGNSDENYKVNIFYPFLKIGQHGSRVDNAGAGGIVCLINDDGVVCTDGWDEYNNQYINHPDSNVKLNGFIMPDWEQALNLVKDAAMLFTENRYIGFDLAHTDNFGWILVEANACGQFVGQQMCDKVGKKKKLDELCSGI